MMIVFQKFAFVLTLWRNEWLLMTKISLRKNTKLITIKNCAHHFIHFKWIQTKMTTYIKYAQNYRVTKISRNFLVDSEIFIVHPQNAHCLPKPLIYVYLLMCISSKEEERRSRVCRVWEWMSIKLKWHGNHKNGYQNWDAIIQSRKKNNITLIWFL